MLDAASKQAAARTSRQQPFFFRWHCRGGGASFGPDVHLALNMNEDTLHVE